MDKPSDNATEQQHRPQDPPAPAPHGDRADSDRSDGDRADSDRADGEKRDSEPQPKVTAGKIPDLPKVLPYPDSPATGQRRAAAQKRATAKDRTGRKTGAKQAENKPRGRGAVDARRPETVSASKEATDHVTPSPSLWTSSVPTRPKKPAGRGPSKPASSRAPTSGTSPSSGSAASSGSKAIPSSTPSAGISDTGKTHALPSMPAAAHRTNDQARRMLKRLVQGETPPTAPMSIVERLVGSPYDNPVIQVEGVDSSARKTLDFALDMAETMFRYGAGALEVETSMIAVTAALGLKHIDVDITNQSVVLNYAKKDAVPITLVRVVRSWTDNYAGLSMVHQLVSDIVRGGVKRQDAIDRLTEIKRRPKPFPRWMVTAATGVWGASITAIIGGGPTACLVAFLSIIAVTMVQGKLQYWRIPSFFATAAASAVITLIALVLWWLGDHWVPSLDLSPGLVVAGGIVLLLPSGRLVSSVQDAINGFPVTAAGRMVSSMMTFMAIVSGIGIGVVIGSLLGLERLDVTAKGSGSYGVVVLSVMVILAGISIGMIEQTSVKMLLPTALVALLGYYVFTVIQVVGIGPRLSPAIAATVIGFAARFVALRLGSPQLVVAVPAILYLLPGLMIFRAMFALTMQSASSLDGMLGLLNALTVALAIAGGVVLGDNLAQPLTKGLGSNERRRRMRRR